MMRREWFSALIRHVHAKSRGTYGSRRVRAELIQGRGIGVSERLVWRLMQDAGIHGLPGSTKARKNKGIPTSDDPVERRCARSRLNELWVSDITEQPTREAKVYCWAVTDTCSRRIVGWSINTVQDPQLVSNTPDMAISQRPCTQAASCTPITESSSPRGHTLRKLGAPGSSHPSGP